MPDSEPSALFTDLYQLTMAQAYWQSGQTADATFGLSFRGYPPDRGYYVLAGVDGILDYLEGFEFSVDDLDFLAGTSRFDDRFLRYLAGLRFTGSVRAMNEGEVFFADEPVVEVTAPVIEAQIVETYLLNQITLQSLLATKAARVVSAARGRTIVDFAARRTHGTDAANKLARASYIVGFAGTSNVLAGRLYGVPIFGTMAHSFVSSFDSELAAFRAYASSFPDSTTLLVDTYDTLDGVRNAIAVAREMERAGHRLQAIRLDSGDLVELARESRRLLDDAGLEYVEVFASGGLDELDVDATLRAGAPIDGFGVGTRVGVSADAPFADSVYKLVEYGGRPVMKLGPGKRTAPGPKQVFRYHDREGSLVRDVIGVADEGPTGAECAPLLSLVMEGGRRLGPSAPLEELRERFARGFRRLPQRYKALKSPAPYPVTTSSELASLQDSVASSIR